MKKRDLVVIVTLFLLGGLPAHAYGDPSGGTFFQVLMPTLAVVWATWLIFANRVRSVMVGIYRKLRGAESEEPTA